MREVGYALRKSTIEIFVMSLLKERDMSAHQMSDIINEKSNLRYRVAPSLVSDSIISLRRRGFVVSIHPITSEYKRNRVLYHIEPAGLEYFQNQCGNLFFVSDLLKDMLQESS